MIFGQRLTKLMQENNIDDQKLAEFLNLSASSIEKYRRQVRTPQLETVNEIANYFKVSVDFLVGNTNIRDQMTYDAIKDEPELLDFWELMSLREDLKLMFKKVKQLTPEAIRRMIEVIKIIEDKEAEERGER